jgi:catecholate siderophore receptor
LAPSIKFGIGTPTEITLQALLQHNHDQPDYGVGSLNGAPVPVGRDTAYGYDDDHTDSGIGALTATVTHKLSPDVLLRNQLQYNYVKTDAVETAPQTLGTVTAAGFVPLTVAGISDLPLSSLFERLQSHDRKIRDYSIYNQSEILAKEVWGGMRHEWLAGIELGHDGYNNQAFYRNGSCNGVALNPAGGTSGYVACVPLLNPDNGNSPGSAPGISGNVAGGSANTAAAYFNDTIALTGQFKLAGGLRYDRYTASISNSIKSLNTKGNTALAYAQQAIGFTSVRLGGIWQPDTLQSYYLSYGTSFNPSLEQLTGTTGQQNLDPEKNKSYELGGKWDLAGGNLALSSAIFQIQKDNARSLVSTGVYELEGSVRIKGFRAGAAGRIGKKLQVALNYSYLDGRIIDASPLDGTLGKVPGNTPKHTIVGWATYEVAPHWEIGGGPQYLSERFDQPADLVRVGGYTRWDATVAYKQRRYDIRVNLFNLTNKAYYDALIQSDGGRSVPGSGRTVMLSFNYHL